MTAQQQNSKDSKRRYWKAEVQSSIRDFILDTFEESKQKVIDDFSIRQRDKLNSVAGFRFRGEPFVHRLNNLQPYQLRRLHKYFVEDFQAHADEWERHALRQHEVNGFINQALNKAKNNSDLYLLLPSCVHTALPERGEEEYPSLMTEQVMQFQSDNEEGVKLLKMQLILNTLKA
ncbi:hypothetical protein [Alteromonas sp. BMJM2]|uniref:hypothetical protein n=1 Tax=Alteromonas sp. BMJM2 TaxID=2954241 RepID=UPI0022B47069|nr:hypothetical protein [Alteromonas sp. BMJM2]